MKYSGIIGCCSQQFCHPIRLQYEKKIRMRNSNGKGTY